MGEMLAELTPRRMIVAVALVTTIAAGAVAACHRHHHARLRHHGTEERPAWTQPACGAGPAVAHLPAPDANNVIVADLDGDGTPERIAMTFTMAHGRFTTDLKVTNPDGARVRDRAGMSLDQSAIGNVCIAVADIWPAHGAALGRIELHEQAEVKHADGRSTCELAGTRTFVLAAGEMVDVSAASP